METPEADAKAYEGAHKQSEDIPAGELSPAIYSIPAHDFLSEKLASESPSTELTPKNHNPLPEKIDGVETLASNDCKHSTPMCAKGFRAEIDTEAPFESVKEAVTLFGERKDWKPQFQTSSMERGITHGFDIHHKVQKDLMCYREQLCLTEASTADAFLELEKTKELIQMLSKTHEVSNTLANEGTSPQVVDPLNQPEVLDVGVPKELHTSIIHELQITRKEIERVKEECCFLAGLKQAALRESEEALNALDMVLNRVEELTTEHASSNEALAAGQVALVEAEVQIELLRSAHEVKPEGKVRSDPVESLQVSQLKLADVKSLEVNLIEANMFIKKLKEELAVIREFEAKASLSVSESEGKIAKTKLGLEQAKAGDADCVAALGRVLEELDEVKANLSKATEQGDSLASAVHALQLEVENGRLELESAHDKEHMACATLASLQDELCSVRDLLMSAQASEAKAREGKKTLPTAIKQVASEADKAKEATKVAKEEVRKATHEIEQAKAATSTAASRLQAAQREAEAAQASEAMALAEFKAVSESEAKLSVLEAESERKGVTGVSISLEEYSSLNRAAHEAEEIANKKVVAAIVQVETAKASQQDTQAKLDITSKEAEASQSALEGAQKKAIEAQEAKLAVEEELRKWRAEHEQLRKTGSIPSSVNTTAAQSPQLNVKDIKAITQAKGMPQSFQDKTVVGLDSLAQVLNLKVPPSEKPTKVFSDERLKKTEKAKKIAFFTRIVSVLVKSKRKTTK